MKEAKLTLKDIAIQILFVVLFVLLLLWLFPNKKFVTNNNKKINCSGVSCSEKTNTNKKENTTVDRIFNENIISMKDAAKSYFTLERLPKKVGGKEKITLEKMLAEKIILPFTDKDGNTCNPTDSYVEVTKYENEYVMKVNLKCGKEENYLLVHMGCYDYCKTTVCEKQSIDVSNPTIYRASTNTVINVEKEKKDNNNNNSNNNSSNGTVINNNTTINNNGSTTINNNTIINNDNSTTINTNINIEVGKTETDSYYCVIVNGKYYDKNGNKVSKEDYEKSCYNTTYKCAIVGNSYYDKDGNKVSKEAYEKSCYNVTYKCAIVDGKYYDKDGNKVSTREAYEKSCGTSKEYLYEYTKTTEGYYTESDWSEWSTTKVTASSTVSVQTKTVTTKVLTGYNVKRAYDYNKPIYEEKEVETGLYETKEVCTKYEYVPTGSYSYGSWTSQGTVYLDYSPSDTATTKYVYIDDSNWVCGENCTAGTTHAYEKYTRTSTPVTEYKCTKKETKSVPITTKVKTIVGYETYIVSKTPVYKEENVVNYRYKTRTYHPGTTDTKWSHYNDLVLLSSGYNYTGNKKIK